MSRPESVQAAEPAPALLTVDEACNRLRCSRWTLYRLIQSGQLKTITIGSRRRVPIDEIADFIRNRLNREAA